MNEAKYSLQCQKNFCLVKRTVTYCLVLLSFFTQRFDNPTCSEQHITWTHVNDVTEQALLELFDNVIV